MNFYLSKNGQNVGPYSTEQIRIFVTQGLLTGSEQVWAEGWPSWMRVGDVPGLGLFIPETELPASPIQNLETKSKVSVPVVEASEHEEFQAIQENEPLKQSNSTIINELPTRFKPQQNKSVREKLVVAVFILVPLFIVIIVSMQKSADPSAGNTSNTTVANTDATSVSTTTDNQPNPQVLDPQTLMNGLCNYIKWQGVAGFKVTDASNTLEQTGLSAFPLLAEVRFTILLDPDTTGLSPDFGTGSGEVKVFISNSDGDLSPRQGVYWGWKIVKVTDKDNQPFPDDDPIVGKIKTDILIYFTMKVLNPYDPKLGY